MTDTAFKKSVTTPEERQRGFIVLFLSLICIGMGKTLMFSILPPLAREMGLTELQVGAIFATNAGAWVIFSPLWGKKSDSWGRRPVLLIGLFGYAISLVALALVTQMGLDKVWPLLIVYPLMVISRLIFGVIGSGSVPAAQAYITDRTSREERGAGMARMAGAFGFGSMVGPAIGGALVVFGYLAPIYFVAFMAFLSGALIWYYLPERTSPQEKQSTKPRVKLKLSEIMPFIIANGVVGLAMAVSQQATSYYAIDVLGMSPKEAATHAGWVLMVSAGTALLSQLVIMPRLTCSPGVTLKGGFFVVVLAFGGLAIADHVYLQFASMALFGFGFGVLMPSVAAAASLSVGADKQGATAGYISSSHAIGNILGLVCGLALYKYSVAGPYIMGIVVCSVFLVYALLNPRINVSVEDTAVPAKG